MAEETGAANGVSETDQNARESEIKAQDAQKEADNAGKSDEQLKADKAAADADDARAEAAQADAEAAEDEKSDEPSTVVDAKVMAPVHHDTDAGHHRAQKFGNDPANPAPAHPDHEDPDLMTVKLTRTSPDVDGEITTKVHPDMAGDYLRAGWTRA